MAIFSTSLLLKFYVVQLINTLHVNAWKSMFSSKAGLKKKSIPAAVSLGHDVRIIHY